MLDKDKEIDAAGGAAKEYIIATLQDEVLTDISDLQRSPMAKTINPVFADFRAWALSEIAKQERTDEALFSRLSDRVGRPIIASERKAFTAALDLLETGGLIDYTTSLVGDYHAGDEALIRLMLTGVLRVGFSSSSSLIHIALTGASGTGKTDLIVNLASLLPKNRVIALTSISNQSLFYATVDESGKSDHSAFHGKILIVNEANGSAQTESLKALAEASETEAFTRKVTVGGKTRDLIIQGARMCLVSSVNAIKDSQTANRFIQPEIERETDQMRVAKARLTSANAMSEKTIRNDPRCAIAAAAYELLLSDRTRFKAPDKETRCLVSEISEELGLKGVGTRLVKDFWSLCQCVAASQSYARGERRVVESDAHQARELIEHWV